MLAILRLSFKSAIATALTKVAIAPPEVFTIIVRFLREPLTWFFAVSAMLYYLNAWITPDDSGEDPHQITVTREDILAFMQYRANSFNSPLFEDTLDSLGADDLNALISDYVREEALVREAKALSLDRNDYISRRRLVQQIEFLMRGSVATAEEIEEEALQAFYDTHADRYLEPETITFTHIFFDRNREQAEADAYSALTTINKRSIQFADSGDETPMAQPPFM